MSEHKMCCGTTCDKQAVAAEIEQLRKERDEALSYAERLHAALNLQLNDCINFDGAKLSDCILEHSTKVLTEYQPAALEELKAECLTVGARAAWAELKRMGMAQAGSKTVIRSLISKLRKNAKDVV